jgi:hypothetical protein
MEHMEQHIYGVRITKTGRVRVSELSDLIAAAVLLKEGKIDKIDIGETVKEVRKKYPHPTHGGGKERE